MARRDSYQLDGGRVGKARAALTLSQEALAQSVGVHRITITNVENGKANVSLDLLERLAVALGVTREHLLGEPEQIDPIEAEKIRIAAALGHISRGFEELNDVLLARLHEAQPQREPVKT